MSPPSLRMEDLVLHGVGKERFAALSKLEEADMEMVVYLGLLHDYVGQERPTALFEQKLKDPNMETQLEEVNQQYQIIQVKQEE